MAVNKVEANGETLIDLTDDTVSPESLLLGRTAHGADGAPVVGRLELADTEVTEVTDTSPYLYKISEHDAVYDEIVGGSVAWNQTIPKTTATGSVFGVTFTNNGDGSWTLTGTPTEQNCFYNLNYTANTLRYLPNHVYFVGCDCNNSKVGLAIMSLNATGFIGLYAFGSSSIVKTSDFTVTSNTSTWCRFQIGSSGVDIGTVKMYPFVTDLTLMFGSIIADYAYNLEQATKGSGVAWLKSYGFFTKDYYPYDTGSIQSVKTSGKKVVGSDSEITYPISPINLRGIPQLVDNKLTYNGDIYSSDGSVTRKYGIVDLGTLTWKTASTTVSGKYRIRTSNLLPIIQTVTTNEVGKIICAKYVTITNTNSRNAINGIAVQADGYIYVYDDNYNTQSSVADFTAAMSGVYLVYELATSTTETTSPYTSPQMVYRNGTEEYIDTRDVPVPVGGNRKYIDIPDWMVNKYFDDLRSVSDKIAHEMEEISDKTPIMVVYDYDAGTVSKSFSEVMEYIKNDISVTICRKYAITPGNSVIREYFHISDTNTNSDSIHAFGDYIIVSGTGNGSIRFYELTWDSSTTLPTFTFHQITGLTIS